MSRLLRRCLKGLALSFAALLLLFSLFFTFMQTKWAQQKICDTLIYFAEQKGIKLTIGSIDASPPFKWSFSDVSLTLPSQDKVEIKKAHLRMAFLALFKREIGINYLRLQDVSYQFLPSPKNQEEIPSVDTFTWPAPDTWKDLLKQVSIPYNFSIRSLKIYHLQIENTSKQIFLLTDIQARGKLKREKKQFFFNVKAIEPSTSKTWLEFFAQGSEPKERASLGLKLKIRSCKMFEPFFKVPMDASFILQTTLEGPWKTWAALATSEPAATDALKGELKSQIYRLQLPRLKALNRKWNAETSFQIAPDRLLKISNFELKSDLLEFFLNAHLNPDFSIRKLKTALSCPNLSLFKPDLPFGLRGTFSAQGEINAKNATFEFKTDHLAFGKQKFDILQGNLKSVKRGKVWEGASEFTAKHSDFLLKGQAHFNLESLASLNIQDLQIKGPDTAINGFLSYDLLHKQAIGTLFAYCSHLHHFRDLFPRSNLDGSLGAELSFSLDKESSNAPPIQFTTLNANIKNLHYFNNLANEISITAKMDRLFTTPISDLKQISSSKGRFSFEIKQAYLPHFFISSLLVNAASKEGIWFFDLLAKGNWRGAFEIFSAGSVKKETQNFDLNMNELTGFILKKSFTLKEPVFIQKGVDHLKMSPCAIHLAHGDFLASLDMDKKRCQAQLKADHFPIDLLTLSYPTLSLQGFATIDAFLDADPTNIQGRLNLSLEQVDLSQYGKASPLKAKGTLQAHLSGKHMQVHTYLKASGDQFLDATLTLPIDHKMYPFDIKIDPIKPLACELTMEGKLEEIFDFINIGSHRTAGLLSAHIYLSKQFQTPSLQGVVELQGGSYENYYTGTLLKGINARIDAKDTKLELSSFSAKDDGGGSVAATGFLELIPAKKFPYEIHADLLNLNALRFDTVIANFTGPIAIIGTSEQALASGTLEVPDAKLRIPDEIPLNIPVLPITFINPPAHLEGQTNRPPPIFPLHLELDLSAKNHISLRGNGLSSEWEGNVHLLGTNTAFAANGKLNLLKGEFVFSGKTFALTQGEITFIDKPTQSAYLNLRGTLALQDLLVTAVLRGPFTAPELTFESMPHKPTSSILSLILFNEDVSELTHMQAVQLAQAVVSLSGGSGPDVLEKIRQSLGVDRLNIVSAQKGPDEKKSDEIALQIGKYLMRGVMVTLSQSADSSQVMVEVELKKGFVFQAETQADQQGKFSLKWNRNY